MITLEKIEGLVLKSIDYKESSKIVYIYTDEGLKSVLIHGANKIKSRKLNFSRVLNYVQIYGSGKNMLTFRDGDILEGFPKIANNLEKYTYSLHILELVYSFSNHEHNHEKLLGYLLKVFNKISQTEEYIPYLNSVELKLLYLLGVNPMFKHCVSCDRTDNLTFSIVEGGMCCPDHLLNPTRVNPDTLDKLKFLYYFNIEENKMVDFDLDTLREIRNIIDKYYEYHLNTKTKSRKLLMGLIGY